MADPSCAVAVQGRLCCLVAALRMAGGSWRLISEATGIKEHAAKIQFGLHHSHVRQERRQQKLRRWMAHHARAVNLGRPVDMGGNRGEQTWTPEMQWREFERT